MSPLVITTAFLAFFSIMTTHALNRFVDHTRHEQFYLKAHEQKTTLAYEKEAALYAEKRVKLKDPGRNRGGDEDLLKPEPSPSHKDHPRSLKIDLHRPPDNSRLNLYLLVEGKEFQATPEELHRPLLFQKLLDLLYADFPPFQQIPDASLQLLTHLTQAKDQIQELQNPEELATIDLEDPSLQELLYLLLRGEGCPSLLEYVTLRQPHTDRSYREMKLNLYFCKPELLSIIFENDALAFELHKIRSELLQEALLQEENRLEMAFRDGQNRTYFDKALKIAFSDLMMRHGLNEKEVTCLFEFTLGKMGSLLTYRDEETGLQVRQRLN